ncbi:hypothetical protein ASPBRDRAFT_54345 [Aspergillus brasiliensis CBS 101740]|uniref:Uncharacterized protein n=1 Tax=Aspergillus brasiliensis (strain CBS 101740 / IMI 381727 / IBT 21946) TaxID=767769 RepID=A0A1L9ULH9_ASPBC|nr:hypothetical protein ASPBRDRAFT_54345 [Aspergillus brasiliensis CBS 101740]
MKEAGPEPAPLRIAVRLGIRQGQRGETSADTARARPQSPCSDRMLICSPSGAASFLCRPRDSPYRFYFLPTTLTGRSPEAPELALGSGCQYG